MVVFLLQVMHLRRCDEAIFVADALDPVSDRQRPCCT
jgi:hypothetical protein